MPEILGLKLASFWVFFSCEKNKIPNVQRLIERGVISLNSEKLMLTAKHVFSVSTLYVFLKKQLFYREESI